MALEKRPSLSGRALMAGAEGLEPSTKVLETHVLPLHHAPMFSRTGFIIQEIRSFVNTQVSILRFLFVHPARPT